MTIDDSELVARWVRNRCESSFDQLVARHSPVVYGAALRSTHGNVDLARDITQRVFIDFATKADSLIQHSPDHLVGWLYTATRFAASKALRSESIRRQRENQAALMSVPESSPPEPDWDQLRPVLDSAMEELTPADRDAVLLRFFESQPLAVIGRHLEVSEDAARMRVTRALEKLRTALAHRGITTTAAALAVHLGAHAITPLPAHLAASLTAGALGLTAGAGATVLTTGAAVSSTTVLPASATAAGLTLMSKSIVQLVLGATLAATAVTPIVILQRSNQQLRAELAAQRANSREPAAPGGEASPSTASLSPASPEFEAQKLEILRLRGEMARLAAQLRAATNRVTPAPAAPPAPAPAGRPPATADWTQGNRIPATEWLDAGLGSPESTMQTTFWAMRTRNVDRLVESLDLPPALTEALQEKLRRKPNLLNTSAARAESVLFLDRRELSPTEVEIDFQLLGDPGFLTRETLKLVHKNGLWQAQLPADFSSPEPRRP